MFPRLKYNPSKTPGLYLPRVYAKMLGEKSHWKVDVFVCQIISGTAAPNWRHAVSLWVIFTPAKWRFKEKSQRIHGAFRRLEQTNWSICQIASKDQDSFICLVNGSPRVRDLCFDQIHVLPNIRTKVTWRECFHSEIFETPSQNLFLWFLSSIPFRRGWRTQNWYLLDSSCMGGSSYTCSRALAARWGSCGTKKGTCPMGLVQGH